MKIAFIDTLGMCYDGDTLNRRGLGGSESAVIQVAKELAKIGFDVTVYNNCFTDDTAPGVYDGVVYCPLDAVKTYGVLAEFVVFGVRPEIVVRLN